MLSSSSLPVDSLKYLLLLAAHALITLGTPGSSSTPRSAPGAGIGSRRQSVRRLTATNERLTASCVCTRGLGVGLGIRHARSARGAGGARRTGASARAQRCAGAACSNRSLYVYTSIQAVQYGEKPCVVFSCGACPPMGGTAHQLTAAYGGSMRGSAEHPSLKHPMTF
eukprot:scaffold25640_cov146-Isochrysis_galbana.AAC.4